MADTISRHFKDLADPRAEQGKRHLLTDMIVITVCAVICGADGWVEVEDFGKVKEDWLRTFLRLEHGIPSHDTFGRVFAMLEPEALERCLTAWFKHLANVNGTTLIAIDGKTLRRSFDAASNKAAIHMISAWCNTNHLVLGQLATEAKSNEITAIPRLLELLDLQGTIVTIDAIGCQKNIAKQIVDQSGNYILQVKANQPTLLDEVKLLFDEAIAHGFEHMGYAYHETVEKDHGRIETRRLYSTWEVSWFRDRDQWAAVNSFVCVESRRDVAGKTSTERRYYLSSLDGRDAQAMLKAVRSHWGIENRLHWSLDVTFHEDACRVRVGHSAEHLARFRRLALSLLKQENTFKAGLKRKRLRCALDHNYLLRVLAT